MPSANEFTPREVELQALAWQCFEGEPKVNYAKLATLAGMTNPVSASNAWAKIKRKLAAQAADISNGTNGADTDGSKNPEKVKTPGKRKKKGGADGEESPVKKAKKGLKGKKKGLEEEEEEEDEEGEAEAVGVGVAEVKAEEGEGEEFPF